jgi:hypothetical protein
MGTRPGQLRHKPGTNPRQLRHKPGTNPRQLRHKPGTNPRQLRHAPGTNRGQLRHAPDTNPGQLRHLRSRLVVATESCRQTVLGPGFQASPRTNRAWWRLTDVATTRMLRR